MLTLPRVPIENYRDDVSWGFVTATFSAFPDWRLFSKFQFRRVVPAFSSQNVEFLIRIILWEKILCQTLYTNLLGKSMHFCTIRTSFNQKPILPQLHSNICGSLPVPIDTPISVYVLYHCSIQSISRLPIVAISKMHSFVIPF